ncbi:MAG: sodium:solute symporter family protein [Campylobacter sp.]|nr:sodium:solute symporter family protein [Campylobacter sp.]
MIWILIIYTLFLFGIGLLNFNKKETLEGFLVANRSTNATKVGFSVMASCIGASATIGLVANVYKYGFPAIWWLLAGALGLSVLALLFAKKLRKTGVLTLPQLCEVYISNSARKISAVLITLSWFAILAAQFIAAGKILSAFGIANGVLISAIIIVIYTFLGGQKSVIKSDFWQFLIVIVALLAVLVWMILQPSNLFANLKFELVNDRFGYDLIAYYILIQGLVYVIDPDIFARIFSAKDENSAKNGMILSVIGIVLTAFLIVIIAFGAISLNEGKSGEFLTVTLFNALPPALGILLLLGLLSAIISSADTCLITASSVFCYDVLNISDIKINRVFVLIVGVISYILTLYGSELGILDYLFAANDIFATGVVVTLFFAIVFDGKIDKLFAILAMIFGGLCGLVAAISGDKIFSFLGVFVAAIFSIIAVLKYESKG